MTKDKGQDKSLEEPNIHSEGRAVKRWTLTTTTNTQQATQLTDERA